VEAGATFDFSGNFDGVALANDITLNGTGVGATPAGYRANTPTPDGFTYRGTVPPLGAIDIHHNGTLSGTITLNTDSRITHSWNLATLSGPIVAAGAGKNLELKTAVASQADLVVSGSMSLGTGALTVNAAGINSGVRLTASNNFSGGIHVMGGKLQVRNANALSSGALTMAGGLLDVYTTADVTVSSLSGVSDAAIGSTSTTAGTSTLTVTQSVATTFSGGINDNGARVLALTKEGTGSLTLAGVNTYSGATAVNGGQLMGVTGGSSPNTVITVADGATNGVQLASADGQWVCAGLTYAGGGSESLAADFGFNTPSTTTAPLLVNGAAAFDGTVTVLVSGQWVGTGSYPLLTATSGFTGTPPTSVVLPPAMTGNLEVIGNTLYLNVLTNTNTPPAEPTILPVYEDGLGNIVIRTLTEAGRNYLLQSTTNLAPPVSWVTNSATLGTGGTITNTVPVSSTPPNQFFRYQVQ
jgi:autotransporter-associated beta strand protein